MHGGKQEVGLKNGVHPARRHYRRRPQLNATLALGTLRSSAGGAGTPLCGFDTTSPYGSRAPFELLWLGFVVVVI